jgi:hypothetical protein
MYKIIILFLNEKKGSSKYVGVAWNNKMQKWQARFNHNKKQEYIGLFNNENDAAKAVNWKCKELKISIKNPDVGALNDKELAQLRYHVIDFYHLFCVTFSSFVKEMMFFMFILGQKFKNVNIFVSIDFEN